MDDEEFVRWMTYAELGRARGINIASATRLAFRRKWKRHPGNDGTARVAVPIGEDKPPHDNRVTHHADIPPVVRALETAVASLSERASVAETRADQAEARADRAEARADRADAALTGERARADELRGRLDGLQNDLALLKAAHDQAQGEAETMRQAEAARKVRGLVARVRAALRGE